MAKTEEFDYIWTDKKRTLFGLPISFTRYFLTEKKLITRTGFLSITEDEIDLYKITDKKLVLSLGQRIFKCGTIVIYSKDTDSPSKNITSVKNPREVSKMLDRYINEQRDKYRIRGRDLMDVDFNDDDEI